jgi:hypothetical protein
MLLSSDHSSPERELVCASSPWSDFRMRCLLSSSEYLVCRVYYQSLSRSGSDQRKGASAPSADFRNERTLDLGLRLSARTGNDIPFASSSQSRCHPKWRPSTKHWPQAIRRKFEKASQKYLTVLRACDGLLHFGWQRLWQRVKIIVG